jgi:hypothetical protein
MPKRKHNPMRDEIGQQAAQGINGSREVENGHEKNHNKIP